MRLRPDLRLANCSEHSKQAVRQPAADLLHFTTKRPTSTHRRSIGAAHRETPRRRSQLSPVSAPFASSCAPHCLARLMPIDTQALLEPSDRSTARCATVVSCIINLASTCMGTGILSLPYAFSIAGFTSGCLLCISSSAFCALSLHFLASSGERVSAKSDRPVTLASVCEAALPNSGTAIGIDCAVIVNCAGCAASYLIVAADCFSALTGPAHRHACVLVSIVVVTPASFFKSLDSLKVPSPESRRTHVHARVHAYIACMHALPHMHAHMLAAL